MSPNASHRVRPGLSSAASLITTLLISFDQEVLNQHLNLVTPEYPFFESPWGQTPEDLRYVALNAPHARTRERALALFDITQHRCATQVALRTGRRAHTVMDWVHAYNQGGPDALTFRRTGGPPPPFCPTPQPRPPRRA